MVYMKVVLPDKKCRKGTHPVPTIICKSDNTQPRQPSKRKQLVDKEVKALRAAITDFQPDVDSFKEQLGNLLQKMSEPNYLKDHGSSKILKGHLEGHLWSIGTIPKFITYAYKQMIDKKQIEDFPDPILRYNNIVDKSSGFHKSKIVTIKTICMSVLETALCHYLRV